MGTIEERARELWGRLPIIQDDYISVIEEALREERKIVVEKAHKAFVELLRVQYGEYCDESMHQYIDDALTKAMEEDV